MTLTLREIPKVDYKISTHLAKFDGYQSKKGLDGEIKAYISNIWKRAEESVEELQDIDVYDLFAEYLSVIFIHERYCLERAFQKIRIKGGMCKPCCVEHISLNTMEFLFGLTFEDDNND